MLWSLRAQWALPLPVAASLFNTAPDAVADALQRCAPCAFTSPAGTTVLFVHQGVRAFALTAPRGGGPLLVTHLSREWGGAGGPSVVTALAVVEDALLLGGACGSLALFAVGDVVGGGAPAAAAPTLVAPRVVIPPEAGAPPSAVAGFACAVARVWGGSGGGAPPFVPRALYLSLDSRELLRCEWAALRACLYGGGGSPSFSRCALGGAPRAVAAVAAANPLVADLFFAPAGPAECFLDGGAGRDALVTGGQGPPLASYHVAHGAPPEASLGDLLGDALQRTLEGLSSGWLGGWLGGGADEGSGAAREEEEEEGGMEEEEEEKARAGAAARAPPRLRAPFAPRTTALPESTLADAERRVEALSLDPTGRYLLSTDSWGRVALVEAGELVVERLWKGYRGGGAGWAVGGAPGGRAALFALLHAPRRGLLEVWRAVSSERAASLRVPRASRLVYGAPPPAPGAAPPGAAFPPPLSILLCVENGELTGRELLQQMETR
jgi:hypothetical protein